MSKEVKVNAEGKELVLRNSAGDYAIIPKNRRAEALKMLEDKCYGCLDALVASLPKTSNEGEKEASKKVEYAQEGLEVEEEEISEEDSFGEAFAKARREKGAGQTFEWRGGTYSTNYEIEPEETQREAIEPVEVTAEAETVTSSTPAPEEEADTTLSTLELQPLDTSSPEVEEEGVVEEGERSNRGPYTGNVDVDKVTAREQRDFMEEFFPIDEEGNIVEEDPILGEFSEEDEVGDKKSFSEAFREARERLGAGQTFEWRGNSYATDYADEVGGAEMEFAYEGVINMGDVDPTEMVKKAQQEFPDLDGREAFIEYAKENPQEFGASGSSEEFLRDIGNEYDRTQGKAQAEGIINTGDINLNILVDKARRSEGGSGLEKLKNYAKGNPQEFGVKEMTEEILREIEREYKRIQDNSGLVTQNGIIDVSQEDISKLQEEAIKRFPNMTASDALVAYAEEEPSKFSYINTPEGMPFMGTY